MPHLFFIFIFLNKLIIYNATHSSFPPSFGKLFKIFFLNNPMNVTLQNNVLVLYNNVTRFNENNFHLLTIDHNIAHL